MRTGIRPENPFEAAALAAGMAPEPLFDAFAALMMARTLMAATSLGVFDALAQQPDTPDGVARRVGAEPAGMAVLLPALASMGYLDPDGPRYEVARRTRRTLLPGGSMPLRDWMRFTGDMWDAFSTLEAKLAGEAPQDIHDFPADDPFWERYMRGLFELSRLTGGDIARAIGARDPERLLDIAGGHGGFAMALCDRHKTLRATIADLEGAAAIGRRIVEEEGYADRIGFRVGDVFEGDLDGPYDLATAFSIVHHFSPERNVELLSRAREALRPGGRMAVFELERPPDGKRGSQLGTLTGVLFYVTSSARTYTADEIASFFRQAGFENVRKKRLVRAPGNVLVLGDRPD